MVRRQQRRPGSDAPAELRSAKPWQSFAVKYFEAGWIPLPLPPRRKSSPPSGTTGKYPMPSKIKLKGWLEDWQPKGNIAIRVPDDVIGIDVDAYADKVGRKSFLELLRDLGPLPDTWTLTARSDGVSGIRFFRVPSGLHWSGEPIADVQIIQHHHRYAVAYPSVHPDTAGIYRWYPPGALLNGKPPITVDSEIPLLAELPALPVEWVDALSGGRVWKGLAADDSASRADLLEWLKSRPGGEPCRALARELDRAVEEISVGGAHDTLNDRLYSLLCLATEGHGGVLLALGELRQAFYAEVLRAGRKGRRSEREAQAEFNRARDGAIRIMMASTRDGESVLEDECGCSGNSVSWGEKLGLHVEEGPDSGGLGKPRARVGKAAPADKYTMDDSGNAEHLLDIINGSGVYVPAERSWSFWDAKRGCWWLDGHGGKILQASQLVGKRQRELAVEYNERLVAQGSSIKQDVGGELAARVAALMKHSKASSSYAGMKNMIAVAAAQDRAVVGAEQFDADPELLACANGTLRFGSGGLEFLPSSPDLRCSLSTGTEFVRGIRFKAWESYCKKFLPDRQLRIWLQKLVGYSLLGGNPSRLMAFLVGETSSGKTTFVKALLGALGSYSSTMNLSLLRDNQDEKPRADIVRALPKRLLLASEASAEWSLHGDQIKRLTGGEPIKARPLYVNAYVEREPAFVPFVATNRMPRIHGADKALKRRLYEVPFKVQVSVDAEDHAAGAALLTGEGRSAVLAWAVRGWELYRESGLREMPRAVADATEEMHAAISDDLDVFIRDNYQIRPDGWVSASQVYERWEVWCAENRIKDEWSMIKFGRELTARGYRCEPRTVDGKSTRVRIGLSANR